MFKILGSIKNIFIHIRGSLKLIFLIIIATALIIGIISAFYKPAYCVTLNDDVLGYTSNKTKLQETISDYIENGEGDNIAFVDVQELPEYSLCLVKRNTQTEDDEKILDTVKDLGVTYYEYYAIVENDQEKYYVATKEEAEAVIDELKQKNSSNINKIAYKEVFGTELQEFSEKDKVVTAMYKKKVTYSMPAVSVSYEKIDLTPYGISFIKPVSSGYTISSRYGPRWGRSHTGTDVAAPTGTTIVAAASGTVTLAGNYGNGYGNYIMINHGNGVQTLYGHCNVLLVSQGQYVSQGQKIAEVGNTGNSTGPHLHFEVRVNGATTDPQDYVY